MLLLIADEIVPIGLALTEKTVSGLTLIVKQYWVYTWIDTGLRNPYGVGHLLHIFPKNYFSSYPLPPPFENHIFPSSSSPANIFSFYLPL